MGASSLWVHTGWVDAKMHHNEMVTSQHTINWFVCIQHGRYIQLTIQWLFNWLRLRTVDFSGRVKRHKVTLMYDIVVRTEAFHKQEGFLQMLDQSFRRIVWKQTQQCNSWLMDSLWHGQRFGPPPIMRSLISVLCDAAFFTILCMISLWLF